MEVNENTISWTFCPIGILERSFAETKKRKGLFTALPIIILRNL